MKESIIRPARFEDGETIAAMVAALSQAEGEPAPLFDAQTYRRDGFGGKPRFRAWIAEVEGRPAGYALHARSYDTDRVIKAEWLCDLYVENWARTRGIGRKLVRHVARHAAAEGAQAMHWGALRRNEAARRFYRRFASEDERLLHCEVVGENLTRLAAAAPLSDAGIRAARPEDAALIGMMVSGLLNALGEPTFEFDAGQRILADGFGPAPRFQVLMAERHGEVQGYALFWPIYETEIGGQSLFLSDLLVAEKARGGGIASDLMSALAQTALAAGYLTMLWEVLEGNTRARAFYRKMAREYDKAVVITCADENFRRLVEEAGDNPI